MSQVGHGRAGARGGSALAEPPRAAEGPRRAGGGELARLLAGGGVRAMYQPIVDLASRAVVAHEALARGPVGSPLESPGALFSAARAEGRLGELDAACRRAAVEGARDRRGRWLFVNVEPETLDGTAPIEADGPDAPRVVIEVTERALTARPAELLAALAEARARGWAIAVDDVGADPRSIGLLPLLRPEVIKLDLHLVQRQPSTTLASIINAVNAEHERSGAVLLAEGIETEAHLLRARAMGATLGQGWLFGRPGPLGRDAAPGGALALGAAAPPPPASGRTPYEVVAARRPVRRADKELLLAVSMQLEEHARALGPEAVILGAFQTADRFTPLTRVRYARLGRSAAFVGALGVGLEATPAPGVRGGALRADDPLLGEWSVVVLGPHFAAALVAVDLGDGGPESRRRFDFALTYERPLVAEAAGSLMRRVRRLPGDA